MTDALETQLRRLGDDLDIDESDALADAVLARLDIPLDSPSGESAPRRSAFWLRAAAAVVAVGAVVALAVPSSRDAIADWFGLDGVDIEQDPDLSVPDEPPAVDDLEDASLVGAGAVVDVDGTEVLVGEIEVGEFGGLDDEAFLSKTLGSGTGIERVEIDGDPGLWIDGEPHVVTYIDADGRAVTERFAGNTLLWQDGSVIHRVEGFATLAAAVAYAEG